MRPWAHGLRGGAYNALLAFAAVMTLKELYLHALVGLGWNWFHLLFTLVVCTALGFITGLLTDRLRSAALIVLNLALSLVMLADLLYWRFFGDVLTMAVAMQARQAGAIWQSALHLLQMGDLLLLADLGPWLFWFTRPRASAPLSRKVTAAVAGVCLLMAWGGVALLDLAMPGFFQHRLSNLTNVVNTVGIAAYHLYDAYSFLQDRTVAVSDGEKQALRQVAVNRLHQDEHLPLAGAASGKNVLMVQMESFQEFVVGLTVGGQEVTPNLNRLARESLYLSAFDQTAQGQTSDATFLATCGLLPLREGSVNFRYPGNEFRCLPQILKERGYRTISMHGYFGSFWNRATVHHRMDSLRTSSPTSSK